MSAPGAVDRGADAPQALAWERVRRDGDAVLLLGVPPDGHAPLLGAERPRVWREPWREAGWGWVGGRVRARLALGDAWTAVRAKTVRDTHIVDDAGVPIRGALAGWGVVIEGFRAARADETRPEVAVATRVVLPCHWHAETHIVRPLIAERAPGFPLGVLRDAALRLPLRFGWR